MRTVRDDDSWQRIVGQDGILAKKTAMEHDSHRRTKSYMTPQVWCHTFFSYYTNIHGEMNMTIPSVMVIVLQRTHGHYSFLVAISTRTFNTMMLLLQQ